MQQLDVRCETKTKDNVWHGCPMSFHACASICMNSTRVLASSQGTACLPPGIAPLAKSQLGHFCHAGVCECCSLCAVPGEHSSTETCVLTGHFHFMPPSVCSAEPQQYLHAPNIECSLQVERDNLYSAFYKLTDSSRQITSFVYDCSASRSSAFRLVSVDLVQCATTLSAGPHTMQHKWIAGTT